MAKMNGLDKLSLVDLKDLKVRVEQAIAEREIVERKELREEIETMAAKAGFSVSELFGGAKNGRKGMTVAVKYRNAKDPSQTWTGRGRPPRWLAEAMKKGAKRESFLV